MSYWAGSDRSTEEVVDLQSLAQHCERVYRKIEAPSSATFKGNATLGICSVLQHWEAVVTVIDCRRAANAPAEYEFFVGPLEPDPKPYPTITNFPCRGKTNFWNGSETFSLVTMDGKSGWGRIPSENVGLQYIEEELLGSAGEHWVRRARLVMIEPWLRACINFSSQ